MRTRKRQPSNAYANGSFIEEIERLRGVAICLVILGHVFVVTSETTVGSYMFMAVRGATWIFIFVSGFLFVHLTRGKTYSTYLRAKMKNVILPYVVVSTAILVAGVPRDPSIENDIGTLHLYYLLGYPVASPLWFIPMIAMFFLAFPLYRALIEHSAVLLLLTPLFLLLSAYMGRLPFYAGPITNFMYFQGAYLLGMLWRMHGSLANETARKYLPLAIVVFVAGVVAGGSYVELARQAQIFVMLSLTIILMLALKHENSITRLIEFFAPLSFGMFFIHGTLTDRLDDWLGHGVHPAIALALGILVVVASASVVFAAKHALGARARYVLGS